jgi:TolB-like protein
MDANARARRVAELFEEVADLPPGKRASCLAAVCGEDAGLQREIAARLALHSVSTAGAVIDPPAAPALFGAVAEPGPIRSLAVLPFPDLSPAKDQEYFSDGSIEELLNVLARIDGIRVPARTSSFALKGKKPRHSPTRQGYALYLASMGRLEEARSAARYAVELDPLSVAASNTLAVLYMRSDPRFVELVRRVGREA